MFGQVRLKLSSTNLLLVPMLVPSFNQSRVGLFLRGSNLCESQHLFTMNLAKSMIGLSSELKAMPTMVESTNETIV